MMNSEALREHSRYLSGRLIDEFGDDRDKQIERLYFRALSRGPTSDERKVARKDARVGKQWGSHW
jgi:hypothetical protein